MQKNKDNEDLAPVDALKNLYYKLKDKVQTDQEIANRDITPEFNRFLGQQGKTKRLINIAIRGEPGSGKSVVGIYILEIVNRNLEEIHNKKIDVSKKITQDQTEFLRVVKDPENEKTCYLIDEFNPFADTGANATTEHAEYEFFTHLCRLYYIHRISCSPVKVFDPNVNVIIDVAGTDYDAKKTKITVHYRNLLEGELVSLGSLWIDVSKVLEQPYYKQYEKKKKARTDFLMLKGYRDLRELEFADIGIEIIAKAQELIHEFDDLQMLTTYIRTKAENLMQSKYQKPISYIALDKIIEPPGAILRGMYMIKKAQEKQKKDGNDKTKFIDAMRDEVQEMVDRLKAKQLALEDYYKIMG